MPIPRRPVLLDATGLAKRCIMAAALDDLKAGRTFTGGLYAALKSLRSIVGMHDQYLGPVYAFFDCGVPQFRLDVLPTYKEKRKERREMLSPEDKERAFKQVAAFERILPLLGVRTLKFRNREADDGIAAACRILAEDRLDPFIVTGDKDMFQLVARHDVDVSVYYLSTKRIITASTFQDEVGVEPENFLLYKLLVGDPSDEIPGVHGVGEKKAAQLIEEVAFEVAETPPGGCELGDVDLPTQVDVVVDVLSRRKKLRKFEQAVVEQAEAVKRLAPVIDLSDSWGDDTTLRRKMKEPAEVKPLAFLRECKRYRFQSITGDAKTFLRAFEVALTGFSRT